MQLKVDHCNAFLRILRQDFRADMVSLSVLEEDGCTFTHFIASSQSNRIETLSLDREPGAFCSKVIDTAKPVSVSALSVLPEDAGCSVMRAEHLEGYLGVPLIVEGRVIATLDVLSKSARAWTAEEELRLTHFASLFLQNLDPRESQQRPHLRAVQQ